MATSYNYVVTASKPTAVSHVLVGALVDATLPNLVIMYSSPSPSPLPRPPSDTIP